jgi:putative addiction module killer protein
MPAVEPLDVRFTEDFVMWLRRLKDGRARRAVEARVDRLKAGNFGDAKPVGGAVSELRIDHGPGYRVYFTRIGAIVVVLLCGGDKSSQVKDIEAAKRLADQLRGART